jgi:isocitrate dehydrogenase
MKTHTDETQACTIAERDPSRNRRRKSSTSIALTIAPGDGIGPEITDATVRVLEAAGIDLQADYVPVGKALYDRGVTSGINNELWNSVERTRLLLKGPVTTPSGKGFKSVNVTLRKTLGLAVNLRPNQALAPTFPRAFPAWTWWSSGRTRKTSTLASNINRRLKSSIV